MFHPRETNPHFQPRSQRYAQLHDPHGSNPHPPQRFQPSPPPVVPIAPHSQEPTAHLPIFSPTSSRAPTPAGLSRHPSPPLRVPPPATTAVPGLSRHPSPPLRVPPPAPALSRYPSPPLRVPPPRKTKRLTWLVAICCVFFWILVILGGLILLIVYLAYRPRYPKFDIASASLNAVYLDLGYLLNGDLTLLANFTNPNKKVNVEFRYMVINLYFEGTLIAARYVEPLSVSRRGYELRDVHMVSSQIPFSRRHVARLNEQMRTGRIMFETKSFLRTTSTLGGFFRYSYWLHGHCKFVVSGPPSGILVAKNCVTKR